MMIIMFTFQLNLFKRMLIYLNGRFGGCNLCYWVSLRGLMLKVLLDVRLLNPLLIQILNELLPLHPVDEWTDVSAVSKERTACQVDGTSCEKGQKTRHDVTPACITACMHNRFFFKYDRRWLNKMQFHICSPCLQLLLPADLHDAC